MLLSNFPTNLRCFNKHNLPEKTGFCTPTDTRERMTCKLCHSQTHTHTILTKCKSEKSHSAPLTYLRCQSERETQVKAKGGSPDEKGVKGGHFEMQNLAIRVYALRSVLHKLNC